MSDSGTVDLDEWAGQLDVDLSYCQRAEGLRQVGWGGLRPGSVPQPAASCEPGPISTREDGRAANPPSIAVEIETDGARVRVDPLGFGHVYARRSRGPAVLSTSARAVALLGGGGLCHESVAVQSLLGWQLGTRTMFDGIDKLGPGSLATLTSDTLAVDTPIRNESRPVPANPQHAARAAATFLRDFVSRHLDEHPNAELQLTGGLDSRILLAAVPAARRGQLTAMTLTVPGSQDTTIAAELAERSGMAHRLADLAGLANLEPAEAFSLCLTAARRVDSAADPLALAAVDFAEAALEPRPRIGGLGGEVARGFYYVGPVSDARVTRRRVSQLAKWRIFSNEAAPVAMFRPAFAEWAAASTIRDLYREFCASGLGWFRAMDEFYLTQRMQRWAGVLGSATALERVVVHPMLDQQFLSIARSVAPAAKKNARFLSQILVELDPELAAIAMDGRPAPITYARSGVQSRLVVATTTGRKVRRKVVQRLTRQHRAPEGGAILAGLVTEHLRDEPALLAELEEFDFLEPRWLDQLASGAKLVEPSAVAMLVTLLATQPGPQRGSRPTLQPSSTGRAAGDQRARTAATDWR